MIPAPEIQQREGFLFFNDGVWAELLRLGLGTRGRVLFLWWFVVHGFHTGLEQQQLHPSNPIPAR